MLNVKLTTDEQLSSHFVYSWFVRALTATSYSVSLNRAFVINNNIIGTGVRFSPLQDGFHVLRKAIMCSDPCQSFPHTPSTDFRQRRKAMLGK